LTGYAGVVHSTHMDNTTTPRSDRHRVTGTRHYRMDLVLCTKADCTKAADVRIRDTHYHKQRVLTEEAK